MRYFRGLSLDDLSDAGTLVRFCSGDRDLYLFDKNVEVTKFSTRGGVDTGLSS